MKTTLTAAFIALSVSCLAQDAKPATPKEQSANATAAHALTVQFEQAKGKLQMPVEKEVAVTKDQPIPANNHIEGVNINTTPGADVHAVFEGVVSSVFKVEGNTIVLVQHGDYFTVYSNLASATVTKGQHVNTIQTLGAVATNDSGNPMVNFQLWHKKGLSSERLLPSDWLRKA